MAGLGFADPALRWRILALALACLMALVGPYVLLTRVAKPAGAGDDPARSTSAPVRAVSSRAPAGGGASRATGGVGAVTGADTADTTPLTASLESCRLQSLRVAAALGAAEVSLAQFDKHIDAMNLLVDGKISLAVATQFWDQTRVEAAQNAAEFERSRQSLTGSGSDCTALTPAVAAGLPFGAVDQLNRCVTYVDEATTALTRADAAVGTWQHHIHDMEMLRMGDITPAQATSMWRKSWKTGSSQLTSYERAASTARAVRCDLD